jgi:vitamin B12 transporter
MHALGLTWRAQWTDAFSSKLMHTASRDRDETTPAAYLGDTRLQNLLWQGLWQIGQDQASVIVERRQDRLTDSTMAGGDARQRHQTGLALGYSLVRGAHSLQANARHDRDSGFGGKTSGALAYGYALTPEWKLLASAGSAFRVPTLFQRFSAYGDAGLKPETSRNLELGLRWRQDGSEASITAYRNRVRGLITYVAGRGSCPSPLGCYENVSEAVLEGITLAGQHRFGRVLAQASVDFQNPRNALTGKRLQRRAGRHGQLSLQMPVGAWTLGAQWQLVGPRHDNAANTTRLGGYGLLALSAQTELAKGWTLRARVDNLTDKHHEFARTYATPGRSVFVSLNWTGG